MKIKIALLIVICIIGIWLLFSGLFDNRIIKIGTLLIGIPIALSLRKDIIEKQAKKDNQDISAK
ncbi:hypothetical protein [Macrococcus armenti]|uniref:hypothetical protein n=1 Tax=Macrococcus armenti TaxID=2875764 RepID=UPI001CCE0021|nr:hypothetical protein [Macrococcus armenti]UBH12398.1 hypothetical protein LAU43_07415 [Macrococcus armenti]UBH21541.1 hypothetical protein LAU42_06995 [Macrococcus armenti]